MKYINRDDLVTYIQEQLLNSSITGADGLADDSILDSIELRVIDLVISYIGGRYDVDKIFGDPVIRNGVLVEIITMITLYRVIRRNAARKVPEDFSNLYTEAIKQLEKIQSGSQYLEDIPIVVSADGSAKLVYGNSRNSNFFI